jgi:hypothetical protein
MENNRDLREEYDFSKLKSLGKGKYAERYKRGINLIHLDPDVADVFHDDKSVNDALRLLISIAKNNVHSE